MSREVYGLREAAVREEHIGNYASLTAAVTAIGSTAVTLVVDDATTITAHTTIPSTLRLVGTNMGSIAKTSTFTLTINGPFEAGLYQVFSGFSAGDVTFGAGAVKEVYPEWWGITGTADDVAINKAIQATTAPNVKLQANKTYYISDSLLFSSVTGGMFRGDGMRSTSLQWSGTSTTDPLLRLFGVRETVFKNFGIISTSTLPLYAAITSETKSGFASTSNIFENLFIQGTNSGGLQYGYLSKSGTGGDNNNAEHSFINCSFNNYMLSAIYIPTTQKQAKRLSFYRCNFSGADLANYAIDSAGSFAVFESGGGYHNIADFHSLDANDYVKIYGWNSEGSDRLYLYGTVGGGPTGASMPVYLQGIRFATNGLSADKYVVYYQMTGTLSIEDCVFGESTQSLAHFYVNGASTLNGIFVKNVIFNMNNAESQSPFVFGGTFNGPVSTSGMIFKNSAGSANTTKAAVFDDADTTPAVFYKEGIYKASNTGATSITDFDAGAAGEIPDQWKITIYFTNNNTTIVHGAGVIELDGGANFTGNTGDTLTLMRDHGNTKWIELSRMDIS